jgi:hypothetical protein
VELHDPLYAKRFYSIYEILEDYMLKVNYLVYSLEMDCNVLHYIVAEIAFSYQN